MCGFILLETIKRLAKTQVAYIFEFDELTSLADIDFGPLVIDLILQTERLSFQWLIWETLVVRNYLLVFSFRL